MGDFWTDALKAVTGVVSAPVSLLNNVVTGVTSIATGVTGAIVSGHQAQAVQAQATAQAAQIQAQSQAAIIQAQQQAAAQMAIERANTMRLVTIAGAGVFAVLILGAVLRKRS